MCQQPCLSVVSCLRSCLQLKYLSAVLNESMRLFPVVSSGTVRITHKPISLAGYHVPAGQPILIPFWTIHRSPKLWDDPEAFRPERWLSEDAAAVAAAAQQSAQSANIHVDADADADVHSQQDQGAKDTRRAATKVRQTAKAKQDGRSSTNGSSLELKVSELSTSPSLRLSELLHTCIFRAAGLMVKGPDSCCASACRSQYIGVDGMPHLYVVIICRIPPSTDEVFCHSQRAPAVVSVRPWRLLS